MELNMNQFKTQEEAIAACNKGCDSAWSRFAEVNSIKEEIDKVAYSIAMNVFKAGYMAGAAFISSYIVEGMKNHAKNPVIEPNDSPSI